MMHATFRTMAAAAALALLAPPAIAHHGWSSYDAAKTLTVTAPLKQVTWGNPHGSAKVDWNKVEWDVVLAPVSRMEARGLTEAMVNKGQTVTLVGYPRTDGTKEMRIERVIVDGKTVELR
jgi:hypothetical protein